MLDFLGDGSENYRQAHDAIMSAIEQVLANGPRTPDMGGNASTQEVGAAVCQTLLQAN